MYLWTPSGISQKRGREALEDAHRAEQSTRRAFERSVRARAYIPFFRTSRAKVMGSQLDTRMDFRSGRTAPVGPCWSLILEALPLRLFAGFFANSKLSTGARKSIHGSGAEFKESSPIYRRQPALPVQQDLDKLSDPQQRAWGTFGNILCRVTCHQPAMLPNPQNQQV